MVGSQKAPTKDEKRRFDLMKQGGCIACLQLGYYEPMVDIHHLLNGYRRGHSYSVALCLHHHRGFNESGLTYKQMKEYLGPSLAEEKKAFHEMFGSDAELLEIQNQIVEKVNGSIV